MQGFLGGFLPQKSTKKVPVSRHFCSQGLCIMQCVEFVWKVYRCQPFFLAFWRRLVRMFLTCAAFSAMVSSVVRSMLSQ